VTGTREKENYSEGLGEKSRERAGGRARKVKEELGGRAREGPGG
jgi:hypothetical protein